MEVVICEKHKKKQKLNQQLLRTCQICLNHKCSKCFTILCSLCKFEHRDHSKKVLKLQDVLDSLNKLLLAPFNLSSKFMQESIQVMKKIKLIKQFKRKIHILQAQTIKQATQLIEITQSIIRDYAQTKQSVLTIIDKMTDELSSKEHFEQIKASLLHNLQNVAYNDQSQSFTYFNQHIKIKQNNRIKILAKTKRKIEQVKGYSMKIIEATLNQMDSEEENQQWNVIFMKKQYLMLKDQLINTETIEEEYEDSSQSDYQRSNSRPQMFKKNKLQDTFYNRFVQTDTSWIQSLEEVAKDAQKGIQKAKSNSVAVEKQLRGKISVITRQKEHFKNDLLSVTIELEKYKKLMNKFYKRMYQHCISKRNLEQQKNQTFMAIIELMEAANLKRMAAQH